MILCVRRTDNGSDSTCKAEESGEEEEAPEEDYEELSSVLRERKEPIVTVLLKETEEIYLTPMMKQAVVKMWRMMFHRLHLQIQLIFWTQLWMKFKTGKQI